MDFRSEPWFDREAYPFEPRSLSLPAGRMSYLDEGDGPAALFVHGTPGWSFEWRHLVKRVRSERRCVAPDHLGFGLSDRPRSWSYGLADHTANLRALVTHLGLARFSLLVHDFGGPTGLPLALDEPERIDRLVVFNSWMWPLSIDPEFARRRRLFESPFMRWMYLRWNFSARFMVRGGWGRHRKLTRAHHRHFTRMFPSRDDRWGTVGFLRAATGEDEWHEALWDRRARLANIPALLVWGAADRFVRAEVHLARWRQVFPRAEIVGLPDVGHYPHDEAGESIADRVAEFLRAG